MNIDSSSLVQKSYPINLQDETDLTSEDESDPATSKLSTATINKYFRGFRDLIGEVMLEKYNHQIGGEGMTVELDESMFGKR